MSKLQFSDNNYYLINDTKHNSNGDKKIVKATKNDCYFNRIVVCMGTKRNCQCQIVIVTESLFAFMGTRAQPFLT